MPGSDAEQCDRGAVRAMPPLLPAPKGVDADAYGARKALLREPEEVSERDDVGARVDAAFHQSAPHTGGHGALELSRCELGYSHTALMTCQWLAPTEPSASLRAITTSSTLS